MPQLTCFGKSTQVYSAKERCRVLEDQQSKPHFAHRQAVQPFLKGLLSINLRKNPYDKKYPTLNKLEILYLNLQSLRETSLDILN